jgi:CubicO group peptidase (beta-lactamase class C family)
MPRLQLLCRAICAAIFFCSVSAVWAESRLPNAEPANVGMSAERLSAIDRIVAEGLRDKKMPGCVVVVGRQGQIVHRKAYGFRRIEPQREEMTLDTIFDLASLTKPISTATSVMKLIEDGKIALDDPVAKHLPGFEANGKDQILVRHLLLHSSGLIPDNPITDYALGPAKAWENLVAIKPVAKLEEKFQYSDVNFLILGRLVEQVSGKTLDEFVQEQFYRPLKITDTGYRPSKELVGRIAPTEKRGGDWQTGVVHDPRAMALGGVAGHAGLFSTGDDLAVFAQMILNRGEFEGTRVLKAETVELMTKPHDVPGGYKRALGWDNRSSYSGNRGDLLSPAAVGHGGFTGTGIWIDPGQDLFVIFLSSRLHPTGDGVVNPHIGRICTVAAASVIP